MIYRNKYYDYMGDFSLIEQVNFKDSGELIDVELNGLFFTEVTGLSDLSDLSLLNQGDPTFKTYKRGPFLYVNCFGHWERWQIWEPHTKEGRCKKQT